MSEPIGYVHDSDGIHLLGADGFRQPDEVPELDGAETAALDVPTIDIDPVSVTDTETGR